MINGISIVKSYGKTIEYVLETFGPPGSRFDKRLTVVVKDRSGPAIADGLILLAEKIRQEEST